MPYFSVLYHYIIIIIKMTFFLLQYELQVILDHTGPHSADTVVTLQDGEGDGTTGNAIPV